MGEDVGRVHGVSGEVCWGVGGDQGSSREMCWGVGGGKKRCVGSGEEWRVYGVSGEGCGRVYGKRKCVGMWGKDVGRGMGEV